MARHFVSLGRGRTIFSYKRLRLRVVGLLLLGLAWYLGNSSVLADCVPNPTQIVSWWPGDGAANDLAGGNNGVLQGGATAGAAGMVANCFSFDGTNGFVQIPDAAALKPTNLTIEAWVRFTGLDSAGNASPGQQYIVFKQNTRSSNFEGFALTKSRITGGDVLNFAVTSASGQAVDVSSSTLVTTGVWYHVAGVRGSNFLQIYVNGQLQRQTNVSFVQNYGTLPLFFGSSGQSFWDGKLKGNLDEVTLYNRALASNEIAAVFAAGAAGKCKSVNISTQPVSQSVTIGSNATFSVAATGFGSLGYRWQFNGTNISGGTNPNLILTNIQVAQAGNYAVVVTNSLSSSTSAVAVLTVNVPPLITVLPASWTTNEGSAASFSVTATGTAPLSYQWRKAGVPLGGQTSNVLAFSGVTTNDAGNYDVVVSNVAGSVTSSPPATLTVNVPPLITVLPASWTTNEGSAASFGVTATGTAPLSYQWRKAGVPLGGQTSNVLAFSVVTTNDAGSYDVVVSNLAGSVTSSPPATLTVNELNTPPAIVVSPQSQATNQGSPVSFSVTATGTAPLSYQWRKDGSPMSGKTNNVLSFSVVTTEDAGNYDVVVTNTLGSVTGSPPASLTVSVPPQITVSPASQTTNQGASVSFSVMATGTAPLNYQWRKAGMLLDDQTNNLLGLSVVTTEDAGNYDVVVSNVAGIVTSSPPVSLTVNVPPLITEMPSSQTKSEGSAVSFSVTATGTAPLNYQWRKVGVPLNGQTSNVLAFSVVATNDAGSYDVVVSNVAGSVTSSPPALLAVNAPPTNSTRADALVIVNSASAHHLDFRNNLQPYLDNFGVPYSVLDVKTNAITTNITQHALIIIGHREIDTNHLYLDNDAQAVLSFAVSNGTGLVNFDYALSGGGVSSNYTFVQDIFGFTYAGNLVSSNSITFPATEPANQMHYITALHSTNDPINIRSNLVLARFGFSTNVVGLALRGTNPVVMVTSFGGGRAVQWAGYNWMTTAVKGPVAGLDDLVWRSFVWAARKPFVMRGMPPMVTLRVDDISGPIASSPSTNSLTNWVQIAVETGFKPYLSLFFNCLDSAEISYIRNLVTNGLATASIHSHGDCGSVNEFFYFNHSALSQWPDSVMSNKFALGTAWHLTNGIPISKVVTPHYSEIGTNAFQGLKDWGVEFVQIEIVPGTVEYGANPSPWLIGAPYRLYETPLQGLSPYPFFYADYLNIPNHPELNGWFFNAYTEIRDDAPCQEFCPDRNVSDSIGRGTRQLKRAFDSMVMGQLFTHDYYFYPIPNNPVNSTIIPTNTWRQIMQGITNGVAGYAPQYVTLDHASRYVRATRTAQLTNATFNAVSGEVQLGLGGHTDLELQVQVFVGGGNAISNRPVSVPAFTNSIIVSAPAIDVPPMITSQPQSQTVTAGASFTFELVATGTEPLTYQWMHEGINVTGGTNATFSLPVTPLAAAGIYSVQISNAAGFTVSSNALLTVLLPEIVLEGSIRPSSFAISFNTDPGGSYAVEYTTNLTAFSWLTLSNLTATETNSTVFDTIDAASRFYRVRLGEGSGESALLTSSISPPQFLLGFDAVTGLNYTVEFSGNLSNWQPSASFVARSTNAIYSDPLVKSQRFYRVKAPLN